jgi:hypothetical protein
MTVTTAGAVPNSFYKLVVPTIKTHFCTEEERRFFLLLILELSIHICSLKKFDGIIQFVPQ